MSLRLHVGVFLWAVVCPLCAPCCVIGDDARANGTAKPIELRQPATRMIGGSYVERSSDEPSARDRRRAPTRVAIGKRTNNRKASSAQHSPSRRAVLTVLSSLGIVLGLLLLLSLPLRKSAARTNLPTDVMEVLGGTRIQGKQQQLLLIRLSNKLLLVNAKPGGMQTLGEVTDPEEVASIVQACHQGGNALRSEIRELTPRFRLDSAAS